MNSLCVNICRYIDFRVWCLSCGIPRRDDELEVIHDDEG